MMNPTLRTALAYAKRGWPVIPLHNPGPDGCSCARECDSPGKHPRTMHGVKDASTDIETINRWWRMWPESNVGIQTGWESNTVVLDVDQLESLDYLTSKFGLVSNTATVATSKGVHLYFTHPGIHIGNSVRRLGPGLDIRADGGYVVAPPSIHISGAQYSWSSPKGVSPSPCPDWLVEQLKQSPAIEMNGYHEAVIANGTRNDILFRLACAMRNWGASPQAIMAALEADNEQRCQPPLDSIEVQRIAASAAKYAPGKKDELSSSPSYKLRPWRLRHA